MLDEGKDTIKYRQGTHFPNRTRNFGFFVQSRRLSRWVIRITIQVGAFGCTLGEERHAANDQRSVRVPDRTELIVFLLYPTRYQAEARYCRVPTQAT
jgi:hypothetical protein